MSEYYSSGAGGYGRYEEGGVETNEEHYQGEYYEEGNFSTGDDMPLEAGGYQDEEDEDDGIDYEDPAIANLPRILLMGPRRGGKTSIQRVVFHKMSPHETLFRLEATQNLERSIVNHTPLCRFTIWDFPGDYYGPEDEADHNQHDITTPYPNQHASSSPLQRQPPAHGSPLTASSTMMDPSSTQNSNTNNGEGEIPQENGEAQQQQQQQQSSSSNSEENLFARATALIFVMDAQDEPYDHVLQSFTETVARAIRANPNIAIEVFINKVDGDLFLRDEAKYDCRRDIVTQVSDELADAGLQPEISYHLTSIYDHSVFEALSRVVQKLIPQHPTLENLLNVLVSSCSMAKAYLFDVASKLYISTDSSPVDMQSVELCSDMIDVVLDVSGIYGLRADKEDEESGVAATTATMASPSSSLVVPAFDGHDDTGVGGGENRSQQTGDHTNNTSSIVPQSYDPNDELVGTLISQNIHGASATGGVAEEGDEEGGTLLDEEGAASDSAYDSESASIIRLSTGMVRLFCTSTVKHV
eukprot:scaffold148415_cov52-Attheya_sp.AAC.4